MKKISKRKKFITPRKEYYLGPSKKRKKGEKILRRKL